MSIKVKFVVSGIDTPLPPNMDLPIVPKMGDEIKYINSERHTVSTVSHISYEINGCEFYAVIELIETKDSKK